MARRFAVQHFVACERASVVSAAPNNPYTLHGVCPVRYVRPDHEWPVRLDGLTAYVCLYSPRPIDEFTIQIVWLDAPGRPREVCEFRGLLVRARPEFDTLGWTWAIDAARFPGPGRYVLRLRRPGRRRVLGRDYLEVRRSP